MRPGGGSRPARPWLLPWLPRLASAAAGLFYRVRISGAAVPGMGPVLLVANHPNAMLDPVLVAAAARRPVRFLAKAPLLTDGRIGWLVRAAGAIPVYRPQDAPTAVSGNADMFGAVEAALADGAAIALFPEGISHDAPAMTELKTGAARIALGKRVRDVVAIVPVGLVLRDKQTFRSDAIVVIGDAVTWDDLRASDMHDVAAVKALTGRIDAALRTVTVNLDRIEDAPLVECAEAVYAVERAGRVDAATKLARLRVAADTLREVRNDRGWHPLLAALRRHLRALERLDLSPSDLHAATDIRTAARWALGRLPLALFPVLAVGAAGHLIWWPPYRLTDIAASRIAGTADMRATYKFGVGAVVYSVWLIVVCVTIGIGASAGWGGAAVVVLPVLGIAGLWIRERWRSAWVDARRFFVLRRRPALLRELRRRQAELAERLDQLLRSRHVV